MNSPQTAATTRTLVLLRHAKSAYPQGVADHERPLAPRGVREAGLAGDWIRAQLPAVEAVLCSTATRTRQTLAQTALDAPVTFADRLYAATPDTVVDEIHRVPGHVTTLLVIGHEPAMSQVALGLAGAPGTDGPAVQRIALKYPTSAIAVLRLAGRWAELEPGTATLVGFHVPR